MARGKVEVPEGPELFEGQGEGPVVEATPPPVDPPDETAEEILAWLHQNREMFTPESFSNVRLLHSKLAEVTAAVNRIGKTGTAPSSMGGFAFVEASNVADVVRKELSARNVTMTPTKIDLLTSYERPTRSGNVMTIETYRVEWTFVDGQTGETHTVVSLGAGADTGDKAAPKAQTNAMKYAMLMAFLIPTGDDPERTDPYEDDGPVPHGPITINASNIPNIRPGGRQGEITEAQFDAIRNRAKELTLDPLGMKQVIEHALKEEDGDDYQIAGWPAGGSIDEQRDAILKFISSVDFDQAAEILKALHDDGDQ